MKSRVNEHTENWIQNCSFNFFLCSLSLILTLRFCYQYRVAFFLPYLAAIILSVFRAKENIGHVGDIFFPV